MLSDLKFAFRQLAKSPGFTVTVVLTLALGIGANTAIFSFVNALLLAPLPYPDSDRIVQISETPNTGGFMVSSGGVFMDWQDHASQFTALAAVATGTQNLTGRGDPVRIAGSQVSADFLKVLGVRPALGRDFTAGEDAPGGNRHVVVISHELWASRFGGDLNAIGQTVRLDSDTYELIGVLPPHALVDGSIGYLTPAAIRADAWKQSRDYSFVCSVIGRLKPGATIEQASVELNTAKRALNANYPSFKQPWGVGVQRLQEAMFGSSRSSLFTLLAVVGFVLLIACANVANLLLARAAARQGEIAVRTALGASRGRLVRQLLTESLLLALAGGLAGTLLGALANAPLNRFVDPSGLAGFAVGLDWRVLLFTLGASGVTGLLFGIFPALGATKVDLQTALKEGARGSTAGPRRRLQSFLIVAETALTVVLLVSAGLLLRSMAKAAQAAPGFQSENVLLFDLTQPPIKSPTDAQRVQFTHRMVERIRQIPGVKSVGTASSTPMNGINYFGNLISREERPETRNDLSSGFDAVAGDYFGSVGIPLLHGRFFTEAEKSENGPRVLLIDQTLATKLFGTEDPLGRLLHFADRTWEVVGVVGNVRRYELDMEPLPQIYYPQIYFPWQTTMVIRTHGPPLSIASDLRRAVHEIDPDQSLPNLRTLEGDVANSLHGRKIMLTLLGIFALTALLLASIGIYGVMSYAVAQRTREMGIRLALGADGRRVMSLIMRDGLKLVGFGLVVGMLGSAGAGAVIASQLYQAHASDPVIVLAAVSVVLLAVSVAALWLPARRATKVDPMIALRAE